MARMRQIDRDGGWTVKRGRKMPPPDGAERQAVEIAVSVRGDKNHLGIDRVHGFIRRVTVTHAARRDGSQLAAAIDADNTASNVRAGTAYRGQDNLALLRKRGFVRNSGTPSRTASRCHRTSPAATSPARGCEAGSSTSSPPRSGAWA
jgi:hypothetical protein